MASRLVGAGPTLPRARGRRASGPLIAGRHVGEAEGQILRRHGVARGDELPRRRPDDDPG